MSGTVLTLEGLRIKADDAEREHAALYAGDATWRDWRPWTEWRRENVAPDCRQDAAIDESFQEALEAREAYERALRNGGDEAR